MDDRVLFEDAAEVQHKKEKHRHNKIKNKQFVRNRVVTNRRSQAAGLALSIKPHLMFGCCRAEWAAAGGKTVSTALTGTVVGSCEAEAAVYALAKLREQQFELHAGNSPLKSAGV